MKDYVDDRLSLQNMELFLQHISVCQECSEELAIYYTIFNGMKKLDEDEDIGLDFVTELEKKRKSSEEKILRAKQYKVARRLAFCVIAAAWIFLTSLSLEREEPEKSKFTLETYFFQGRESKTQDYIKRHDNAFMAERIKQQYQVGGQ